MEVILVNGNESLSNFVAIQCVKIRLDHPEHKQFSDRKRSCSRRCCLRFYVSCPLVCIASKSRKKSNERWKLLSASKVTPELFATTSLGLRKPLVMWLCWPIWKAVTHCKLPLMPPLIPVWPLLAQAHYPVAWRLVRFTATALFGASRTTHIAPSWVVGNNAWQ